jgi:hypothetical protein
VHVKSLPEEAGRPTGDLGKSDPRSCGRVRRPTPSGAHRGFHRSSSSPAVRSAQFPAAWEGSNRRLKVNSCERVILKRDGVATARDWSSKCITLNMLIMDRRPTHTPVTRCQTLTRLTTVTPGTPLRCFVTNFG